MRATASQLLPRSSFLVQFDLPLHGNSGTKRVPYRTVLRHRQLDRALRVLTLDAGAGDTEGEHDTAHLLGDAIVGALANDVDLQRFHRCAALREDAHDVDR